MSFGEALGGVRGSDECMGICPPGPTVEPPLSPISVLKNAAGDCFISTGSLTDKHSSATSFLTNYQTQNCKVHSPGAQEDIV